VLLFTDGVTEAMNAEREFFGIDRLRASLSWIEEGARAEQVLARVQRDVAAFCKEAEAADDITLMALRWLG
jgi:serine phosphatase RsbU (regulator of sigma subunit)